MADTEKLRIARRAGNVEPFDVMINPASYSTSSTVVFTSQTKLSRMPPPTPSLPTLVLDGTGVVPSAGTPRSVDEQLQALRAVLFEVEPSNDKDRQPVVVVSWGSLRFEGRAQSMEVQYTLFTPEGIPLRASVTLRLATPEEVRAAMQKSAKEAMAQRRLMAKAGTLPQLCFESYSDPTLDQEVARRNGLTSIRNVPPGTSLALPGGA